MELFYSNDIQGSTLQLDQEESSHCVRVLRHREGDKIHVIDGKGNLFCCILEHADPKNAEARVVETVEGFGSHPYRLVMAVCPTKNMDRYEWFAEKATELGVDVIVPVIGERSERKIVKTDRLRKILISAAKQSLKAAIPEIRECESVREFIAESSGDTLKLIACCFEGSVPRTSIRQAVENSTSREIRILIGPEGDFSEDEAQEAVKRGFIPIHLGGSRLRTETAALTAVEAIYLNFI